VKIRHQEQGGEYTTEEELPGTGVPKMAKKPRYAGHNNGLNNVVRRSENGGNSLKRRKKKRTTGRRDASGKIQYNLLRWYWEGTRVDHTI